MAFLLKVEKKWNLKALQHAINEISTKLRNGEINDDDRWHTVKWMTSQKIGLS